jgi:hypothetical protein
MAISSNLLQVSPRAIPARSDRLPVARRALAIALGLLLLAASLLKLWSDTRNPPSPHHSWTDGPRVAYFAVAAEAALGCILLAGLWPGCAWFATLSAFSLFALVTAAETLQGKTSCGCFGAVQIRPIYTMSLDLAAVAMLLIIGTADRGSAVVRRASGRKF